MIKEWGISQNISIKAISEMGREELENLYRRANRVPDNADEMEITYWKSFEYLDDDGETLIDLLSCEKNDADFERWHWRWQA